MKTIKAKVHMLPTDKTSDIISDYNGQPIPYTLQSEPSILTEGYFHLYITTDEEIKEGDWLINIKPWSMKIIQATKMIEISEKQNIDEDMESFAIDEDMESFARKIIATTDPELRRIIKEDIYDDTGLKLATVPKYRNQKILPQIPQSFIEEYCKAGGIDEVLVEWEIVIGGDVLDRPKLNPNNTIIIHPVEEKMIPLSEVKELIKKYNSDLFTAQTMELPFDGNKWIEENL
jgi:hypothetical protein